MRTLEGKVVAREIKVGIVAARFNEFIVSKLVAGARDGLLRHDVKDEDIDLEFHCKKLAKAKDRRGMIVIEDTESGKIVGWVCLSVQ